MLANLPEPLALKNWWGFHIYQLVVSNCRIDALNLYPTYRKPFDLIAKRAKNEEWCARHDSNMRPSGS